MNEWMDVQTMGREREREKISGKKNQIFLFITKETEQRKIER